MERLWRETSELVHAMDQGICVGARETRVEADDEEDVVEWRRGGTRRRVGR